MYAKFQKDEIELAPVRLGNGILRPGEFVKRLGENQRTMFEMQDGYHLRYVGKSSNLILFSVNDEESKYYYAFFWINPNRLFLCSAPGQGYDVRLKKLEKVTA